VGDGLEHHRAAALAEAMGVPPAEIALVRNATEALDTVLLGLPLRAGDEVVCSPHDYYAMLDALEQRRDARRRRAADGRLPAPAPSLDALAAPYEAAIGPRTKLVLLTHPSNLTGQLLPVRASPRPRTARARRWSSTARSRSGCSTTRCGARLRLLRRQRAQVAGAPRRDSACSGCAPRTCAPCGRCCRPAPGTEGMARFEWIGTAPEYVNLAALPALALHRTLGPARKAARLRALHDAPARRARRARAPGGALLHAADPAMSLGLTTVELPGVDRRRCSSGCASGTASSCRR
jgi:isopenicillin-N epimerase